MARLARVVLPVHPHRITQRGNRRQDVFFCDEDYERYLSLSGPGSSFGEYFRMLGFSC